MILKSSVSMRTVSQVFSRISFASSVISSSVVSALRSRKPKSVIKRGQRFVDFKKVRVYGGKGGDGSISFMRLWSNPTAGPDGGDGGNGGHVIFQACSEVKDLSKVVSVITGKDGERGNPKNCHGSCADHTVIKVPIGTVIKRLPNGRGGTSLTSDSSLLVKGKVVGDLNGEGTMYVGARGGAGGHGNAFYATDTLQSPQVAEFGAQGEEGSFVLELRSISHFGLIGFPNAGKSTLLCSITRARPKVAPYPFTTLKPHLGIVHYSDLEQISVADLPGLLPGAHKNRGLGLSFLRHAERCLALLLVVDASYKCPWEQCREILAELKHFDPTLPSRALLILANKMDLPQAKENLENARKYAKLPIIPISAKMGNNLSSVLSKIRVIYDLKMANYESPHDALEF